MRAHQIAFFLFMAVVILSGLRGGSMRAAPGGEPVPESGDSPGRERVVEEYGRRLVEAANTREDGARKRILMEIFSEDLVTDPARRDRLTAAIGSLGERLGTLRFHHTEIIARSVHVFVRTGEGRWRDIQLRFQQERPWRFTQLVFLAEVTEPVYLPNGRLDSPEVLEWLGGYIDRLAGKEDLSGSVLLVKGEKTLLERSFGWADAGRTRKVTSKTRFNLGSGTKMFTAVAVLQLAREGRLDLDDPIIKYLPEIPWREWAMKATLRHLLSHTSGAGDYWTEDYERSWRRLKTLRDVLPFALAEQPAFAPGEGIRYSNTGFLFLGLVIEKVTGEDYFDVIRRRIYGPAGMTASGSFLRDGYVAHLADPLSRAEGGGWKKAELALRGTSAGGSYSTTADMLKFTRALRSGAYLGRQGTADLLRPRATDPESGMELGYGFFFWKDQDSLSFGHGGTAPGVNFELRHFPREGVTLVIFSNQDNGAYDDLRKNIVKLVTGAR